MAINAILWTTLKAILQNRNNKYGSWLHMQWYQHRVCVKSNIWFLNNLMHILILKLTCSYLIRLINNMGCSYSCLSRCTSNMANNLGKVYKNKGTISQPTMCAECSIFQNFVYMWFLNYIFIILLSCKLFFCFNP